VARTLKSDKVLFIATLLLVCASIVMVYSASAVEILKDSGRGHTLVTKQALFVALGICVLAIVMRVDYRIYRAEAFVWSLLGLVGLLLLAVLIHDDAINGSKRWLGVGDLRFQPSELAKLATVLSAALFLERRMHRIDEVGYSLLPIAIVVGVMAGLILLQPDLGTAAMLLLIAGVMVFAAGLHYRHVIGAIVATLPLVFLAIKLEPYRWARFVAFWHPESDPFGKGWQQSQSIIAVGTGGLTGRGLTEGVQKLAFVPYPESDFIFAVVGEELGLIGATAMLVCFCVIAWRGLRIALRAQDPFGALVAIGLTTMISVQAFINISVALRLLPTKGIPLPLVSLGGSSMLVSLLAVGMLLNISQHEVVEK
jgi:cell division protein FtsW